MNPFRRWLLWTSSFLTGATGLIYWWMDTMMKPVDEWAVISHPLQPVVLKAHILVAPVLVFAVGLIAGDHIWRHYRQKVAAGRRSGLTAMWIFIPMVATGYLIQSVTHAGWLEALAWTHIGAGAVYLIGVAAHHRTLRNVARRQPARLAGERPSAGSGGVVERGAQQSAGRVDRSVIAPGRASMQRRDQLELK